MVRRVPASCSRRDFLAWLSVAPLLAHAADARVVVYPPPESDGDERSAYRIDLLRLAFAKLGLPYRLRPGDTVMPQGRALRRIEQQQEVDVFWSMTSVEREQQLLPIRIPIDRGLLGWRLLLIRNGDAARFAAIDSLAPLARLSHPSDANCSGILEGQSPRPLQILPLKCICRAFSFECECTWKQTP